MQEGMAGKKQWIQLVDRRLFVGDERYLLRGRGLGECEYRTPAGVVIAPGFVLPATGSDYILSYPARQSGVTDILNKWDRRYACFCATFCP